MLLLCDNNAVRCDRSRGGVGRMMVGLLRLCCAVGACVLAAGLLMGFGGAVAAAEPDPDPSGSATQTDDPTTASAEQSPTGARVIRSSNLATFRQPMARLFRAANQASSILPGAGKPEYEPSGVDTQDETKGEADLGAAVTNDLTPGSDAVAPLSDPVAAVPDEVAPVSDPVAPLAVAGAPVPDVAGPVSNVGA